MYQEMRTKDDAWMQSIHESIDQLSEILDSMPEDSAALQNDDEYLCNKEVAYMLKVSRRTLSEYRSNGTLPYYVLGGKVIYKRSEIEQALKREYNGKHLMNITADKSLLYLSQARIYSALALKNIQASLMFLARLCYIFGGSEIYRLSYIHLLQNNSALMDRDKNSIQKGYQCKNPFAFAKLLPLNINLQATSMFA